MKYIFFKKDSSPSTSFISYRQQGKGSRSCAVFMRPEFCSLISFGKKKKVHMPSPSGSGAWPGVWQEPMAVKSKGQSW